eukprot:CAMPEP_0205923484 /NCGR_PEP_ID=MMETSP1325-20131115/16300_1 /ASSEMBLY_ACC=CAM_ASM_000708 /TAXON_ID=236786 /ORGANISM="Florenciella sp., Strain RCC1007" /LENGTH=73 /DNA_ID=CAMNT_0053291711 /DNA_START=88 /DNA_END=305 /DNA_ORIENTATION=+
MKAWHVAAQRLGVVGLEQPHRAFVAHQSYESQSVNQRREVPPIPVVVHGHRKVQRYEPQRERDNSEQRRVYMP